MRTKVYDLKTEGYKGWVKIAQLTQDDRLGLIEECNFEVTEEGTASLKSNSKILRSLLKVAPKFIKELEVIHKASKVTLKTWDDMRYEEDFYDASNEIAFIVLNGQKTGES